MHALSLWRITLLPASSLQNIGNARHDVFDDTVAALAVEHIKLSRFFADFVVDPCLQPQACAMQTYFYIVRCQLQTFGRLDRAQLLNDSQREDNSQVRG